MLRMFTDDLFTGLYGKNVLFGKHILGVSQIGLPEIDFLFELTRRMRLRVLNNGGVEILSAKHKQMVLACLFYEPSTRTSASFISAMERLGGSVIPITQGVQFSSVSKGESLPDTVQTLGQYADAIVLRHPEVGSAAIAAAHSPIPIINAGDGVGEHPTQALLDLFTIQDELKRVNGLKVVFVGDLRYGRTVHSLVRLLTHYDVKLRMVSPEILRLPLEIMNLVKDMGVDVRETHDLLDVVADADVVYVTRVQKERFTDMALYEAVAQTYVITPELMAKMQKSMVLMHPLPRVGEIQAAVDTDPRAAYFRQVKNGMYLRMALLAAVLLNLT